MAEVIAAAVQQRQGVLSESDLAAHRSAVVEPISTEYRGHRVYEVPPPTQVPAPFAVAAKYHQPILRSCPVYWRFT